jgi:type I restriction enzyme, R subunit
VTGPTDVGTGRPRQEDKAHLSQIVDVLNERFGTEFTKEDQLLFDQIVGDLKKDDALGDQACNHSMPQFKLALEFCKLHRD